jgi:hypothetical protein
MTYKEFEKWCNDRASDGCWNMLTAMTCIDLINEIKKVPYWKREKAWKSLKGNIWSNKMIPYGGIYKITDAEKKEKQGNPKWAEDLLRKFEKSD